MATSATSSPAATSCWAASRAIRPPIDQPAKQVRPVRLHLADLVQVEGGHGLDAIVRLLAGFEPLPCSP